MPYFDGRDGRVYYRHWAANQLRAGLIFLHGFGEHSGLYHRYAAALGARDIDLWALDEIGHGLTYGARGDFISLDDLAAHGGLLASIAETATPGLPLVLGGHSLGSLAAILLALDCPGRFRGLVISGAALSPLPWLQDAARDQQPISLDPAALSADPFYLDELENDPLAFTATPDRTAAPNLSEAFPAAWRRLEDELPALTVPVLAVHGSNDQITPIDGVLAWRDRLPGLRVIPIAEAAHDVLNERAHRHVAATIADFILTTTKVQTAPAATSAARGS